MPPSWTNLLERTFEIAEAEPKHILKVVGLHSQEEETKQDQVQDQDIQFQWDQLDLFHQTSQNYQRDQNVQQTKKWKAKVQLVYAVDQRNNWKDQQAKHIVQITKE